MHNDEEFIYAMIHEEDGKPVILVTYNDNKLFLAETAAEAVAEMLVRGIKTYYHASNMDFSEEWGWPSPSANAEMQRHFQSLEGMARQRGWTQKLDGEGGIFDVVDELVVRGFCQKELSEYFTLTLEGMQVLDGFAAAA